MNQVLVFCLWHVILSNTDNSISVEVNEVILCADATDPEHRSTAVKCNLAIHYRPFRILGIAVLSMDSLPLRCFHSQNATSISRLEVAIPRSATATVEDGDWAIELCELERNEASGELTFRGNVTLHGCLPEGFQRWPISRLRRHLRESCVCFSLMYSVPDTLLATNELPESWSLFGHGVRRAFNLGDNLWRHKEVRVSLSSVVVTIDDSLLDSLQRRIDASEVGATMN